MRFYRWVLPVAIALVSLKVYAAENILEKMTLQEKVGQLFIFGFRGHTLTPELQKTVTTLKPGGLILFGRNIKTLTQVAKLNSDLQKLSLTKNKMPLLLAVDQEGGAVTRIKTSPPLPSAYTIGGTNEPTLAFQAGKVTGEMLSVLGFNMNLAPVLDMTDEKLDSFISVRSFSASPSLISSMGLAFAQGLAEARILPVAKHFPGHGPILLDTHHMTPQRRLSLSTLMSSELIPFTEFASSSIPSGIMVAHIVYPELDASLNPATYSHKLVSDLLLDQLKFKGLVMTDDIEMAGAASLKNVEDRAVAAVLAGNDLIMVGWTPSLQRKAVHGVLAAVKSGKIPMERINQSVRKIISMREKLSPATLRVPASTPVAKTIAQRFKNIQYGPVFNGIIARYFKQLPGKKVMETSIDQIIVVSPVPSFHNSFNKVEKSPQVISKSQLSNTKFTENTLLIYHITSTESFEDVRKIPLEQQKNTILISSHPKLKIQDPLQFLGVVETFSHSPLLGKFTAEAVNKLLAQQSNAAL